LYPQQAVIYRYNSDYVNSDSRQTPVHITNVSVDTRWDDAEETARGNEGWGYSNNKTSYFFQDSSSIKSMSNVSQTFVGPHTFSGELWIKPHANNGQLLYWGDSVSSQSIGLSIDSNYIYLAHMLDDQSYELIANSSLMLNKWSHIIWHSIVSADSINLGIIINGQLINEQSYNINPTGYVIYNAPITIGYRSNDTLSSYRGELYSANIKNYFFLNDYINSSPSFDGSAYCGIPNYFDYSIGSSSFGVDRKITINPTEVDFTVFVPYQNDDFIPQGVTNIDEGENFLSDSSNMVYISLYYKNENGITGLRNSIIVELDPENAYSVRRCFRLQGVQKIAHNGGIAYHNNNIYVASNYKIEKYEIPTFDSNGDKYIDLYSNDNNVYSVSSKASYVTYFEDSLWIGDYRGSNENDIPYLFGYPINASGDIVTPSNPAIYRMPSRTQGVAWLRVGSERKLFISQSNGGSNYSSIYRCDINGLSYENVPEVDTVYNIPAGAEDISFNRYGDLITVSESAAKYFNWNMFYPFVYSIPNQTLIEGIDNGLGSIIDSDLLIKSYDFRAYPNPFNNKIQIYIDTEETGLADLRIHNMLGQQIYFDQIWLNRNDVYTNSIDFSEFSSGIYSINFVMNNLTYHTEKILYLK